MKRVPIFKPGKHTSANGVTLEFSQDMLAASVAAYNPETHPAPLVIGHPKDNGPAFGWVERLEFNADTGELDALPKDVNADFLEGVKSGAYRMRSASFYTPDSPSNPVPGVYYLRHVGFLGAMPPAIKGLSAVQFSDDEEGVLEFADMDPWALGNIASVFRRLRDWMLGKHGQEVADAALPSYLIEDLEASGRRARETPPSTTPNFSEEPTMTPEQIAQQTADLAAARARLASLEPQAASFTEREQALAARERAAAVATIATGLQAHVTAGRVLPVMVPALAEFMAGLPADGEVVEFGEPVNGVTPKVSPRAFMEGFLAKLPKAVDFQERAPGNGPTATDLTAEAIAEKARAHIKKVHAETGREVSYVEAVNHVVAETAGT